MKTIKQTDFWTGSMSWPESESNNSKKWGQAEGIQTGQIGFLSNRMQGDDNKIEPIGKK